MTPMIDTLSPLLLLTLPVVVSAFSFTFTNTPKQCQNLSISISGSGQAPYSVLILPFGPSPLPNNVEVRQIVSEPFSGSSTSLSFKLKYPANSQFVAVVSDSSQFGSGGTSVAAIVQPSSDANCFDPQTNTSPDFVFSIEPPNQIVQCMPTRIWWDPATVKGNPQFLAVIPGGQSFSVPEGTFTNVPQQGTGFTWTPSVRGGTTLLLVGGDDRGQGSAGSVLNTVSSGITTNNSCLESSSPSSTPGSPAGGSYPTSSDWSGSNSGPNNNTAAIVGGVVGGVVGLIVIALVILFFWRRKRRSKSQKERPVILLQGDEGDAPSTGREPQLPEFYQPEPFLVANSTADHRRSGSSHDAGQMREVGGIGSRSSIDERPQSRLTLTTQSAEMPGGSATASTRKSGVSMRPMRLVNIIQHDDAGPSESGVREEDEEDEEEPETVELPPAYTNLKK